MLSSTTGLKLGRLSPLHFAWPHPLILILPSPFKLFLFNFPQTTENI